MPYRLRVRDFHPLWCAVPGRLPLPRRRQRWPTPHIPQRFPNAVRFVLFRVHSPLLTEFLLISFPPPTKMLQFGGFPFLERNGTMCQEVPFGNSRIQEIHASPRDLSQLVTTFVGSRAEPSPNWVVASLFLIGTHYCEASGVQAYQFWFLRPLRLPAGRSSLNHLP